MPESTILIAIQYYSLSLKINLVKVTSILLKVKSRILKEACMWL